jgi:hypothetical protein
MAEAVELPALLAGHWETPDGRAMAAEYATQPRSRLCGGQFSDMEVAFKIAMLMRSDTDFEPRLAMAKDRIRWLSTHLAIARQDADCGLRIQVETMTALSAARERQFAQLREARDELLAALEAMLPENCGPGDDPAGHRRPSFEKCESARAAIAKAGA